MSMLFQNIGISNKSPDSVSYTIHNERKGFFFRSVGFSRKTTDHFCFRTIFILMFYAKKAREIKNKTGEISTG